MFDPWCGSGSAQGGFTITPKEIQGLLTLGFQDVLPFFGVVVSWNFIEPTWK